MKNILSVAIMSLFLLSCATVGKDINQEDISKIEKGVTTENTLISTFGKPYSQSVDSDGNHVLVWTYAHAVAFTPAQGKSLVVKLNSSGVVDSFTTTNINGQPVVIK